MRQAQRDLGHARMSASNGDFEWACFAAQQSAEKALKAVFQRLGGDAWGHSVTGLLDALPGTVQVTDAMRDSAMDLDRHYIAPRYPNSYPEGAPCDFYTPGEANRAIATSERIIRFCKSLLARPRGDDRESAPGDGGGEGPQPGD